MSILYLLTAPAPSIEGTDAVFQDIAVLRRTFTGAVINLNPLKSSRHRYPKQFFGFHKIPDIRRLERQHTVNHVFFGDAYPFPIFRLLRNPVIFTVTGSLDFRKKPLAYKRLQQLYRIVVSTPRDAAVLERWGLTNYEIVPPGIDTSALKPMSLPLDNELILLMASAPWNNKQFESKGINLLLAAAAALPFLRVILLWRGVLADEVTRRVQSLNLENRVEIVNRRVNVSDYLQRAHAAILLCSDGRLVKAYPHSLIEALAAGKPVLLTKTIAMAEFVEGRKCGVVIPNMNMFDLQSGLQTLMSGYQDFSENVKNLAPNTFSVRTMLNHYRRIYNM